MSNLVGNTKCQPWPYGLIYSYCRIRSNVSSEYDDFDLNKNLIKCVRKHIWSCCKDDHWPNLVDPKSKMLYTKVERKAKIWNRYNQVPFLTRNTIWVSDKKQKKTQQKKESIQSSTTPDPGYRIEKLFPSRWSQGCKEQTRQHNKDKHET